MNELIEKELSALVSFYRTIEGTCIGAIYTKASYTETSYNKRFDELLGESVTYARAATLKEAAARVVEGLGSRTRSVTVTDCKIAVIRGRVKVAIHLEIRKVSLRTSVSSGVFTGEQEYSVERQAIETTGRNRDDVDQPMKSNDDHNDTFSTGTCNTNKSGLDLSSKQTNQSYSGKSIGFSGDSTSINAEMIESEKTSVSIYGSPICLKKP
jgi:hypothetical protein